MSGFLTFVAYMGIGSAIYLLGHRHGYHRGWRDAQNAVSRTLHPTNPPTAPRPLPPRSHVRRIEP